MCSARINEEMATHLRARDFCRSRWSNWRDEPVSFVISGLDDHQTITRLTPGFARR